MILLATNKRDITTDFIVLELRRRDIPFQRLNCEDLPSSSVKFSPSKEQDWQIEIDGSILYLRDVRAAYYRRPGLPELPASDDIATHEYLASEWSALTRSLWNTLEGRWLNSPFAILRAEDKPRQLMLASKLGFLIPDTVVTNNFKAVTDFTANRGTIGKPLRHALIERGETGEVLFTHRLKQITPEDLEAISLAPVIYQGEIPKSYDVRVTVIGEQVFAVAIHSQEHKETTVDWRSGTRLDLHHETIQLPKKVRQKCVELTKALDLRFGAIDLVADKAGQYWFLEINPNGQWAWIERRTGLPLATAIVDELSRIAT